MGWVEETPEPAEEEAPEEEAEGAA
jgi:hypothetical protein